MDKFRVLVEGKKSRGRSERERVKDKERKRGRESEKREIGKHLETLRREERGGERERGRERESSLLPWTPDVRSELVPLQGNIQISPKKR